VRSGLFIKGVDLSSNCLRLNRGSLVGVCPDWAVCANHDGVSHHGFAVNFVSSDLATNSGNLDGGSIKVCFRF